MKKIHISLATLFCLFLYNGFSQSKDQQLSQTDRIQKTFKDLNPQTDQFTQKTYYYDKRVDIHNLTDDGMFASLAKNEDGYLLRFVIYHQVPGDKYPDIITGISVRAGDTIFNLQSPKISGNGTHFANTTLAGVGNDSHNYIYNILHRIIESGVGMIRFKTANTVKDYTLSKREIKELKTVVDAWEAWNGL